MVGTECLGLSPSAIGEEDIHRGWLQVMALQFAG